MHPLDKWLFKFNSIGTETTPVVVVIVFLLLALNRYLSLRHLAYSMFFVEYKEMFDVYLSFRSF